MLTDCSPVHIEPAIEYYISINWSELGEYKKSNWVIFKYRMKAIIEQGYKC